MPTLESAFVRSRQPAKFLLILVVYLSNLIRVTACAKILTQRAHGFRAKARLQRVSRARATERATGRATEREEWGVCMGGGGDDETGGQARRGTCGGTIPGRGSGRT